MGVSLLLNHCHLVSTKEFFKCVNHCVKLGEVLLPYKMVRFSGSKRRQLFFSVFTEKFLLKPIHVEVLEFLSIKKKNGENEEERREE